MSKGKPKVPQVSKAPKVRINRCVTLIIKPLRIFQFIMVLLIFVLVIYIIASNSAELSTVSCILLIILSGVYVFVLAVDLISQISGGEMQAIPMFVFSLSGVLLFGIAGILLLITYRTNATWYIWMTLIFSLLLCALFIFDVVMLLAFWRRRCELCKRCCVADQSQILFQRNEHCHPRCPETVKYDLTTSISNIRVSSGDEERTPDHSYRKVGYGRRRQYVDCPTSTRSVPVLDIAQVQTEPNATSTIESQTRKSEVKEIPVQTVSRCELCNRQIQFYDTSDSVMSPMTQHQAPCTPCPAFVQLIRGGTCCPGCKCVAGIVQVQQMQRKPSDGHQRKSHKKSETDEQVQWIQEVDQNTHGMLTSEKARIGTQPESGVDSKLTAMPGTITKLTVSSFCVKPNRKVHSSCQTAYITHLKTTRREKPELINTKEMGEEAMKMKKETKGVETGSVSTIKREMAQKLRKMEGKELDFGTEKEEREIQVPRAQRNEDRKLKDGENLKSQNREMGGADKQENKPVRISTQDKKERTFVFDKAERKETEDNTVRKVRRKSAESGLKYKQSEHVKLIGETRTNKDNSKLKKHLENRQNTFEMLKGDLQKLSDQIDNTKVTEEITPTDDIKKGKEDMILSAAETELSQKQIVEVNNVTPKKYGDEKEETEVQPTSSRAEAFSPSISKRTRAFSRKNKIEPVDVLPIEENTIEKVGSESTDQPNSVLIDKSELPAAEKEISTAEQSTNICPACKRQKYHSVYKDKRGRFYCELCATPNSIEMLPVTGSGDNKRIICANCGRSISLRKTQDVQPDIYKKSNVCPKCSQPQVQRK